MADETLVVDDLKVGRVRVTRWRGYHFRTSAQRPMDILRVEVLQPKGRRQFKPLWLAWVGEHSPPLEALWPKYLRRFALEHGYRFASMGTGTGATDVGFTMGLSQWRPQFFSN